MTTGISADGARSGAARRDDPAGSPPAERGFADLFDAITANVSQVLHGKQEAIESQINDVIRGRGVSAEGQVIITPEEYEELLQKEEEKQDVRRKLREVEYNLRKDIERLGTRVKWINILAVPGVVALTALALGAIRVQRRSAARRDK